MGRKLRHHEQKLLKRVDFLEWKSENKKEHTILQRFHLENREDYMKYNKICGHITKLAGMISLLDTSDPFRKKISELLLSKAYESGLISHKETLSQLARVTVGSFCKRRLSAILIRLKMCQNFEESINLIRQGHIRVGPEVIKEPSFLVTRNMEDFVTWVDQSKIKRKIATYYDNVDDFEL